MKFKEIAEKILETKNGSLTSKAGTYYTDIHYRVNRYLFIVSRIPRPAQSDVAILLKGQLTEILESIEDKRIRVKAVGARK